MVQHKLMAWSCITRNYVKLTIISQGERIVLSNFDWAIWNTYYSMYVN
jgi:hypothetical protein